MIDSSPEAFPVVNSDCDAADSAVRSSADCEITALFEELRVPLLRYLFGWILLTLVSVAILLGQAPQGEIRLQVQDQFGAPVEASGRLTSISGGKARTFHTDSRGAAVLRNLAFGPYRLIISKPGFATQSVTVDVESSSAVSRVVSLQIGAQTTRVDVVANTPLPGMNVSANEIPSPVQTAS